MSRKHLIIGTFAIIGVACLAGGYFYRGIQGESERCLETIQIGADFMEVQQTQLAKRGFKLEVSFWGGRNGPTQHFYRHEDDVTTIVLSVDFEHGQILEKKLQHPEKLTQRVWRRVNEWVGMNDKNAAYPKATYNAPPLETKYETTGYPRQAFDAPSEPPLAKKEGE